MSSAESPQNDFIPISPILPPEMLVVRDEITILAASLKRLQASFTVALEKVAENERKLHEQLRDVEVERNTSRLEAMGLRRQNDALKRAAVDQQSTPRTEDQNASLRQITGERDIARKSLKHARKCIKDLLIDKGLDVFALRVALDESGRSNQRPTDTAQNTARSVSEGYSQAKKKDRRSSEGGEGGGNKNKGKKAFKGQHQSAPGPRISDPGPSSQPGSSVSQRPRESTTPTRARSIGATAVNTTFDISSDDEKDIPNEQKDDPMTDGTNTGEAVDANSSSQPDDIVQEDQEHLNHLSDNITWIMNQLPRATQVECPSLRHVQLQEHLNINTALLVERIRETTKSIRLENFGDAVFLHAPIFVEKENGKENSYLTGWGEPEQNVRVVSSIFMKEQEKVYHTFQCPPGKGKWTYLGKLRWELMPDDFGPFWPAGHAGLEEQLAQELQRRWNCGISVEEIMKKIRNGELRQICIRLSSTPQLFEMTKAFGNETFGFNFET